MPVVLPKGAPVDTEVSVQLSIACVEREWAVTRDTLVELWRLAERVPQYKVFAHLFLLAYSFLLRLPSEAVPVTAGGDSAWSLKMEGPELVLTLRRRKNRPHGSVLRRRCCCRQSKVCCVVHVFGPILQASGLGQRLFRGVTANSALRTLREMLGRIGLLDADNYCTHDFRRGHALDLQLSGEFLHWACGWSRRSRMNLVGSGAPLYEILEAGQWTSPAFLKYLDVHRLETELVVQVHFSNGLVVLVPVPALCGGDVR